jgi:hypothetical protein
VAKKTLLDTLSQCTHSFNVALSLMGLSGALAATWYEFHNGVAYVGDPKGYLEYTSTTGKQWREDGKGFHLSTPFTTASIKKWEPEQQTIILMSSPREKDYLKIEMRLSYTGLDSLRTHSSVRWPARAQGSAALKDIFKANNWNSYVLVNPEKYPANAAAVCAKLTDVIVAGVDKEYARDMKVTRCNITAYERSPLARATGWLPE